MLQEKILAGKYKDCSIVYDHVKIPNGDDVYFNNFTVKTFELADLSKGSIWDGVLTTTARAAAGQDNKEQRLISVEWRNGEKSLLQISSHTYKRVAEALFGSVPKEFMEDEEPERKSRAKFYILGLIIIAVLVKVFLF